MLRAASPRRKANENREKSIRQIHHDAIDRGRSLPRIGAGLGVQREKEKNKIKADKAVVSGKNKN